MREGPAYLRGTTTHARRGAVRHVFTYGVDYVLVDPEAHSGPPLFSRNRMNLASVHDRNHGGVPGKGVGAEWAWGVLAQRGLTRTAHHRLRLLTQPRFLGYIFNPVSFWLLFAGTDLIAAIAEVNNTFGDRHSYVCANPDFAPISADQQLRADKVLHVSPFQQIAGDYAFRFAVSEKAVDIRILHSNGAEGLSASLSGALVPLTNRAILGATLRRPFGPLRTMALIHWHALKLKLKGATYRTRPLPPENEVS
ncbi:MAG: DUF1365 domain-containing protein [Brevirhabdus sp.]